MKNDNKVLASGIDSLSLAINVNWKDESFFNYLEEMKAMAVQWQNVCPIFLYDHEIIGLIKPYGQKGHQWIVYTNDFELTIGNWLQPKSRPSVMAYIRSEALWRAGPIGMVEL